MALTASNCASPLKAEVIRVTRLDECGIPVSGSSTGLGVFDAFTEVTNSPQYEDGQEYILKKANGDPCVNQKDDPYLKWLEQTVNLCTLDPRVMSLITGMTTLTQPATGTGTAGMLVSDAILNRHFSLELWTPIAGASNCDTVGAQQWFYWAFPNMHGAQIQDFTFQNDVFTFSWTATSSPMWSPSSLNTNWIAFMADLGVPMPAHLETAYQTAGGTTFGYHYLWYITTTPPPTPACGTYSLPL